jgi:hypothetical protein
MKSEELRRYEEEFRAMRELLGTYCLELGLPSAEAEPSDAEAEAGPPSPSESGTTSSDGSTPMPLAPSRDGS